MYTKKISKLLTDGLTAHQAGDIERASNFYNKVLKQDRNNADALHLLGLIAYGQTNLGRAYELISRAIKHNKQEAVFWNSFGLIHKAMGNYIEAIKHYQRSLQINPQSCDTWSNMGVAWHEYNNREKAIECYQKALTINPQHINTLNNLGQLQLITNRYSEALITGCKVLDVAPNNPVAMAFSTTAQQRTCIWDNIEQLQEKITNTILQTNVSFIPPFAYQSMTTSPEALLRCSESWSRRIMRPLEGLDISRKPEVIRQPDDPIRLAYWSTDLREHAVGYLLAEVFACHDRNNFEVTLLSYGEDDGSAIRRRHMEVADHFIDIRDSSLEQVVHLCRERKIDILIDLTGYTNNSRSQMLAMHAAPIQAHWLGFPGTLGSHHVDYILADDYVIPEGHERYYTEKVARIPNCYQPQDSARVIAEPMQRHDYGLPETGIVFNSFCQSNKILPGMFDVWMRILSRVPDSVLWLVSAGTTMENNIRSEAVKRGINEERIVFTTKMPLDKHLARYLVADIALDTYPYGSHGTASDALWAGCPLITLVGDTFPSRVAGSVLRAAGLPDLITKSKEEYEELAVSLALNPEKLKALRLYMSDTRATCALFDTPAFTKGLEETFHKMIEETAKMTLSRKQ